ncbi:Ig-like domain-containing protein [Zobellia nedashkovskayae]
MDLSTRINDADGDELEVSVKNDYRNGAATISGNTMLYTPNPGYSGIDSIVYIVNDGNGGEDVAIVTFNVMPISSDNQSPVALSSSDVISGKAPLTVKFTGSTSSNSRR